jgi:hypothetical protein
MRAKLVCGRTNIAEGVSADVDTDAEFPMPKTRLGAALVLYG